MKFVYYSDWDSLPESAHALFLQNEKVSIFNSRQWFECLTTRAMDLDHRMILACVEDEGRMMAMLPLMECKGVNTWYSLAHGLSPYYSLLLDDDNQERVLAFLALSLFQLPINALLLEPISEDDTKLMDFARHLEKIGFKCEKNFRHYNWVYQLQGQSYQEYMAGRPTLLRNTISRKMRKLEREHGYEIRLFSGVEVLSRMPDYHVVYNASWKQNEIWNADYQDCFIESFAREGWTRLAIMYIREQPVAAQLWFVHHNKASIFRLAYDDAWRQYSVGSILTSFLIEYVIDIDKVGEIDFLTGNDTYKQDWMSKRREHFLMSCIKSRKPQSRYGRIIESFKQILN